MMISRFSKVALPFALALAFLGGCQCPEPHHVQALNDSPEHVRNVEAVIGNAQARQTWTLEDERAFTRNIGHLSIETRFAQMKRIAGLINSRAMRIDRTPPKPDPGLDCPCRQCGVPTPAPPPPVTQVPTTDTPPTSAQPRVK